jgi:hypothetical protein
MAFDRKDYGMNKSIPFIKIANRVEVKMETGQRASSGFPTIIRNSTKREAR